ncbi:hypothetical protein PISMIDRAFT_672174 [Pisolithus microcarpus 441]|uniref:Uncharacterized protein n=1 Tax=Pisolithus microcarpus 441 TaxID=765257 RepID=A0A0D0A559_9AGAM|nr:hypothetical protein PISMIDRAFT_672174 [Pisolithus microcarpus 441]
MFRAPDLFRLLVKRLPLVGHFVPLPSMTNIVSWSLNLDAENISSYLHTNMVVGLSSCNVMQLSSGEMKFAM